MTPEAILAMAAVLAPGAEHTNAAPEVASAIAEVAASRHEAAVLLVMGWEESRFKRDAIGDGGRALGIWQDHRAPRAVLKDVELAARIARDRLRASAAACPRAPLAVYASGSCLRGRRRSAYRMREVAKLEAAAANDNEGAEESAANE